MDDDIQPANECLVKIIEKGSYVPKDASIVYMYEVQAVSHSFRGFNMEELNLMAEAFPVVTLGAAVNLFEQGDRATFIAVLLRGSAQSYSKGNGRYTDEHTVIDYLERGDFIGQNVFFTPGNFVEQPHHVKVTSCVNVVMLISYQQLKLLNQANPHLGHRMMTLAAEAASERVYSPSGCPPLPELESVVHKSEVKSLLRASKDDCLVEGFSEKELDILVDRAGVMQFEPGQKVFHQGRQAKLILVLLSGGLETRGPSVRTFTEPGDVVGESMFPFITHKHDTFTTQNSHFLAWSYEDIYKLNAEHPEAGLKFSKNIIQLTLKKMHNTFRPGAFSYDPEKQQLTKLEKEMSDLRWIATSGLQKVLREGSKAMSGGCNQFMADEHCYEGKSAINRICEIFDVVRHRLEEKDEELAGMVKVKDYRKMVGSLERNIDSEQKMRATIKQKENQVETLKFRCAEQEQKILSLEEEVRQKLSYVQEVEADMVAEREAARNRYRKLLDETNELKKRVKDEDPGILMVMKQQNHTIDELKAQIKTLKDEILDHQYEEENLQQALVRVEKDAEQKELKRQAEAEEAERREQEAEEAEFSNALVDETIPRLHVELADAMEAKAVLRWQIFARGLMMRNAQRPMFQDVVKNLVAQREEVKRLTEYKAMAEDLKEKVSVLEATNQTLQSEFNMMKGSADMVQQELQKRFGEVSKMPEMQMLQMKINQMESDASRNEEERLNLARQIERTKDTILVHSHDVDKLSLLSSWLLEHTLDQEVNDRGGGHIMWRKNEVALLKTCWNILARRNYLKPSASNINIDELAEVLLKREFENFQSPITYSDEDRNAKCLWKILASADLGAHQQCTATESRTSGEHPREETDSSPLTQQSNLSVQGLRKGSVPTVPRHASLQSDDQSLTRRGSSPMAFNPQTLNSQVDNDPSLSLADRMKYKGVVIGKQEEIEETDWQMKSMYQADFPKGKSEDMTHGESSSNLVPPRKVSLGNELDAKSPLFSGLAVNTRRGSSPMVLTQSVPTSPISPMSPAAPHPLSKDGRFTNVNKSMKYKKAAPMSPLSSVGRSFSGSLITDSAVQDSVSGHADTSRESSGLNPSRSRRVAQTMHVTPITPPAESQVRFAPKRVNPTPASVSK